jgi:glyoxylase-like metal-dependent hydrolase (beta-lactamase superfamily II)
VSAGHEIYRYDVNGPAYLGFAASFDVYGDDCVVIVPVGGHTDGSVIVFASLPDSKRYAFVGDLTWQLDGIRQRVERPPLMRKLADVDPGQVRENLLCVISIADLMQVVPAHDVAASDGIPRPTPVPASEVPEWIESGPARMRPTVHSEITWLLHRAAQRMVSIHSGLVSLAGRDERG